MPGEWEAEDARERGDIPWPSVDAGTVPLKWPPRVTRNGLNARWKDACVCERCGVVGGYEVVRKKRVVLRLCSGCM